MQTYLAQYPLAGAAGRDVPIRYYFFGCLVVALFVALSIVGILRTYTPIPTDDDWSGYLAFYADLLDGKYSAWFEPNYGHRPILPRVLFWLDIRYFGGRFIFLTIAALIMLFGVVVVLLAYLRMLTAEKSLQFIVGLLVSITAVSWLQFGNLTSGNFGAHWFMAMLLPLLAFYWLARAQERKHNKYFLLALAAGIASVWTLADGMLVLPLLAIFALCIGLKSYRVAILALLGLAMIAVYFEFGQNGQSQLFATYLSTLTRNPGVAVQYVFGFLGNPFFYVVSYPIALLQHVIGGGVLVSPDFGGDLDQYPIAFAFGFYTAEAAGVVLILGAVVAAAYWFAGGCKATRGAPLFFLIFIILTAVASAAGRLSDAGVSYSFSPRYMTPALLGWIALILLGTTLLDQPRALTLFVCVFAFLLPSQCLPLGLRNVAGNHERLENAMRIILDGSDDAAALKLLGADAAVAHRLRGTNVSIFASELMAPKTQ